MSTPAPDLPAPSQATTSPSAPIEEPRPGSNVGEYVSRPRFHQRLTLPATDGHGELAVTYAVGGSQDPSAPTLLFIGGMFGGRYVAVLWDYICREMGVRVVSADRWVFSCGTGHDQTRF
ncbi:hypothetical protein IMZ48_31470 [Candidatus Bathyarchaeota archaeon]|nr:hypothetical protein [Candidatus Bathyarchaeota archaeon]